MDIRLSDDDDDAGGGNICLCNKRSIYVFIKTKTKFTFLNDATHTHNIQWNNKKKKKKKLLTTIIKKRVYCVVCVCVDVHNWDVCYLIFGRNTILVTTW